MIIVEQKSHIISLKFKIVVEINYLKTLNILTCITHRPVLLTIIESRKIWQQQHLWRMKI